MGRGERGPSPCQEYQRRLGDLEDYLEGQLASAALDQLVAHLALCRACRATVEEAQASAQLLRAALQPEEPLATPGALAGFWSRVEGGIRAAEERRQQFWRPFESLAWRLSWSTAAVLILLAGYFVMFDSFRKGSQAPTATEVRELFPEPVQEPADRDEVLLALAANENGR